MQLTDCMHVEMYVLYGSEKECVFVHVYFCMCVFAPVCFLCVTMPLHVCLPVYCFDVHLYENLCVHLCLCIPTVFAG